MSTQPSVPETVKGDDARALYSAINELRKQIKDVAYKADQLRQIAAADPGVKSSPSYNGEIPANAFRHLEDASMRCGKVLQALDGGVSVYDRSTTVGA